MNDLYINGLPESLSAVEKSLFRTRISTALADLCEQEQTDSLHLHIGIGTPAVETAGEVCNAEFDISSRSAQYESQQPLWSLDQLVAPISLIEELQTTISLVRLEPLVFDDWGLREIEPFPRSALNFHGGPGTGKTLAAHAVASELGKNILVASYAQIESKYHGDGPKNVEAIFHAARQQNAVLFMDEADSLLSRRLTNVTQGSEQAINSMRSQILICLEKHVGVVIFATNLVENYDRAFETRVRHIHFPQPDIAARTVIWQKHLPQRLPLHGDVEPHRLAGIADEFCGRDIKNAVVNAALSVARRGATMITHADFAESVGRIVSARDKVRGNEPVPLDATGKTQLASQISSAMAADKDA
jgi:ATP-dependent 26S proteasome regulatory subunit